MSNSVPCHGRYADQSDQANEPQWLHAAGYDDAGRDAFFDELRRRFALVPGVAAVAAPTHVPLHFRFAEQAVLVCGVGNPSVLLPRLRTALHAIDPDIPGDPRMDAVSGA